MENTIIASLSAIAGFLSKSSWDMFWNRKNRRDLISHQKRLDFMERQLTEFYWPVFFLIQKSSIVWNRIMSRKDDNDSLLNKIDYNIERNFFYPNNQEIAKIIESKYYLAQADKELKDVIMAFLRHQSVFSAIKQMKYEDLDPVELGEPWPQEFYAIFKDRTLKLQAEYDDAISR